MELNQIHSGSELIAIPKKVKAIPYVKGMIENTKEKVILYILKINT